jgi:dolichyl-phosphate beta-glucosyltransferase
MHLSVIIPAYNEAKRVGSTLQSVGEWLARQPYDSEIIVVDNRSNDGTADAAQEYHQQFPFIRVIKEPRPGKGMAVKTGMLFATGEVRLFMDMDSSTTIDHLERALPYIEQGYDIAIGSLAVPGAVVLAGGQEPLWRQFLGKLGNLWIQFWAVPGIWDTQRGFKVFTARAAQIIFPRVTIAKWGFDVEVLAIAREHRLKIKEFPVRWNNPTETRVTMWTYPEVLLETVRVFWGRIMGKYR